MISFRVTVAGGGPSRGVGRLADSKGCFQGLADNKGCCLTFPGVLPVLRTPMLSAGAKGAG